MHGNQHPTVRVCAAGYDAEIDAEIAPLIREMWLAGIGTACSCQGEPDGHVWIDFEGMADLERFATAVADRSDGDVVYGAITRDSGWDYADTWWRFELLAFDITMDDEADEQEMPPDICFWPRVEFPRQHLAEVQRLMQSYNRRFSA